MCKLYAPKIKKNDPLRKQKYEAIKVAKDFGYLPQTVRKIAEATTEPTIYRALTTARESNEEGSWSWKYTA